MGLIENLISGDTATVARLISKVEKHEPEAIGVIKEVYSKSGNAHIIGVTGPPGVGKSCLVGALVSEFRKRDKSVGVLAVDPTSPLSGGAFLGDRDRMIESCRDDEVFIRSLASRGSLGGLSEAVNDAADILDVAGKDVVIIETVGVGQSEVEIAKLAHTVVLALMPGYGDSLQILKAGIMEVSDIFVVNKADKPGADYTVNELESYHYLDESHRGENSWYVPVVKTCAIKRDGVDSLVDEITNHHEFLKKDKNLIQKNKERRIKQFLDILTRKIEVEFMETLKIDADLQKWVKKISDLKLNPYSASEQVINMLKESRKKMRS